MNKPIDAHDRKPHAVLDVISRRQKGLKIERLLGLDKIGQPIRMLEIGTGSGGIAHYFATHEALQCHVDAVDVHDNRQITDGYDFHIVTDTRLPFASESFDVVLSNHVIEHVGERAAQIDHLSELRRVLKPGGLGYLAVPNRWMLIEPHYRLAFLSWLPRSLRSPYLRAMKRGEVYDCEPLTLPELNDLLKQAELHFEHIEIEALREVFAIEGAKTWMAKLARFMPGELLVPLRSIVPTLICKLERT